MKLDMPVTAAKISNLFTIFWLVCRTIFEAPSFFLGGTVVSLGPPSVTVLNYLRSPGLWDDFETNVNFFFYY